MKINRRNFFGLSGALVLAGLVKKWLPEEKPVAKLISMKPPPEFDQWQELSYDWIMGYWLAPIPPRFPKWDTFKCRATDLSIDVTPMKIHAEWYKVDDGD